MAVSLTAFNNLVLYYIWRSTLVLVLLTFVVLFFLLLRKGFNNWRQIRLTKRRQQLTNLLLVLMDSALLPDSATLKMLKQRGDDPLICDVAAKILRTVRGRFEKRIIQILNAWNILHYLQGVLRSARRDKRIQALSLLAHFRDSESLELLLQNVNSNDLNIQFMALHGLAERSAIAYLPNILQVLIHSKQRNTRMLAWVLKSFREPAVAFLIELAKSQKATTEVRTAAILALMYIGSLAAVLPLIELADDGDFEIRAMSIAALSKIGDTRAADVILNKLQDSAHAVRMEAAHAAGSLGLQTAITDLVYLLQDEQWWVRYRAAEALFMLGGRGTVVLRGIAEKQGLAADIARQLLAEKGEKI